MRQRRVRVDIRPDRARPALRGELAEPAQAQIEGRRGDPLELGMEIVAGLLRHLADEAQRQVHVLRRHPARVGNGAADLREPRSEEHTSALQSLMRISYAVFCLKKTK